MFSVFARKKVSVVEEISFTDFASAIRLPDCFKSVVNWKNDSDTTIGQNDVIGNFFDGF